MDWIHLDAGNLIKVVRVLTLLKNINSSKLKFFNENQLKILAKELRSLLINTVSKTGGHLAPSLGVIELTIAIHKVFDTAVDRVIFDVGHQCYAHKILTGRADEFHTLRQYKGISGFPKRDESIHDAFGTGHSSTSISAALGMALARDLSKEKYSVVALIGDGALTGGMSFEALNHAGHLGKDLIVVLNDNEMSICKNVGGLSKYLCRIRTDPMYSKSKEEIELLLSKLPIGKQALQAASVLKGGVKYLLVPGMFFEELGFKYLGPVDGHNIMEIVDALRQAKIAGGPVLVHVITKKGKGYRIAEQNPDKFHGIGPFDVKTGEPIKRKNVPTYTDVFGDALVKLAAENNKIIAITAAMTSGTGLKRFAGLYPDRFFDVGIAEQHAVTMAAGMACQGYKPVVAIYSTFLQRAYDQVLHDVCIQKLPVVFAIDRAGIVGDDGATHQGVFDISFLRHIPNIVIMAPKDENELRHMLKTAVEYDGPCALRYPRGEGLGCKIDDEMSVLKIGKSEVLNDHPDKVPDVVLIAVGNMVWVAKEASLKLAGENIHAVVINARFIKPLDEDCIIEYAKKSGKVITIEEHVLAGGFGSAVLELLADRKLNDVEVMRIGIPDEFVEHGKPDILRRKYGLTVDNIVDKVKDMVIA